MPGSSVKKSAVKPKRKPFRSPRRLVNSVTLPTPTPRTVNRKRNATEMMDDCKSTEIVTHPSKMRRPLRRITLGKPSMKVRKKSQQSVAMQSECSPVFDLSKQMEEWDKEDCEEGTPTQRASKPSIRDISPAEESDRTLDIDRELVEIREKMNCDLDINDHIKVTDLLVLCLTNIEGISDEAINFALGNRAILKHELQRSFKAEIEKVRLKFKEIITDDDQNQESVIINDCTRVMKDRIKDNMDHDTRTNPQFPIKLKIVDLSEYRPLKITEDNHSASQIHCCDDDLYSESESESNEEEEEYDYYSSQSTVFSRLGQSQSLSMISSDSSFDHYSQQQPSQSDDLFSMQRERNPYQKKLGYRVIAKDKECSRILGLNDCDITSERKVRVNLEETMLIPRCIFQNFMDDLKHNSSKFMNEINSKDLLKQSEKREDFMIAEFTQSLFTSIIKKLLSTIFNEELLQSSCMKLAIKKQPKRTSPLDIDDEFVLRGSFQLRALKPSQQLTSDILSDRNARHLLFIPDDNNDDIQSESKEMMSNMKKFEQMDFYHSDFPAQLRITAIQCNAISVFLNATALKAPSLVRTLIHCGTPKSEIKHNPEIEAFVRSQLNRPTTLLSLNDSQQKAVESSMKFPVSVIQGPPGTGKTRTMATMIRVMLDTWTKFSINDSGIHDSTSSSQIDLLYKPRVFAAAYTQGACDNILKTLDQLKIGDKYKIIRLGNPLKINRRFRKKYSFKVELDKQMRKQLKHWQKSSKSKLNKPDYVALQSQCSENILNNAQIIIGTAFSAAQQNLRTLNFDAVLLDEASQTMDPALLMAINLVPQKSFVMVGDSKQLAPLTLTQLLKLEHEYGRKVTMFDELSKHCEMDDNELPRSSRIIPEPSDFGSEVVYAVDFRHPRMKYGRSWLKNNNDESKMDSKKLSSSSSLSFCRANDILRAPHKIDKNRVCVGFTFLDTQYRMRESICQVTSKLFYCNRLKSSLTVKSMEDDDTAKTIRRTLESFDCIDANTKGHLGGIIFVDSTTDNKKDTRFGQSKSHRNLDEAGMIITGIHKLVRAGISPSDIGVISFYKAQVNYLRGQLQHHKDLQVATVDSFQGREKSIILLSTVARTQPSDFLKQAKRMNVAISRAQRLLLVFGNRSVLLQCQNWDTLVTGLPQCSQVLYTQGFQPLS